MGFPDPVRRIRRRKFRGFLSVVPEGVSQPGTRANGLWDEMGVFQNLDTHGDHAPGREDSSERPSSRPSPGGRRRKYSARFAGLSQAFARTSRNGSHARSLGVLRQAIGDSLSPPGEGRGEGAGFNPRDGSQG